MRLMKSRVNRRALLLSSFFIIIFMFSSVAPAYSQSYRSRDQIIVDYLLLEQNNPVLVSHDVIGYSVEGKEILMFKIGNPEGKILLIDATIHGNEHATSEALYYIVEWLLTSQDAYAQKILTNVYLWVIPIVNMDSYGTSRFNDNNVDLNRNFETGWYRTSDSGPYALSEPETRAIHNIFLNNKVSWYLNLHTGTYRVTPPWGYTDYVPEEPYYRAVYTNISKISADLGNSYAIPFKIEGGYAGGLARDEGQSHGAYTYAVEIYWDLIPRYYLINSNIVPRLKAVVIGVANELITNEPFPEPEPEPNPEPDPEPQPDPEPEIVTETFGWTQRGRRSRDLSNRIRGTSYTLNKNGVAESITVYLESWDNGERVVCGIYDRSTNVLVAQTEIRSSGGSNGWHTFYFDDEPTLEAGDYVLVVHSDYFLRVRYDKVNVYRYFDYVGSFSNLPDDFDGTIGYGRYRYSIYCTYTYIS